MIVPVPDSTTAPVVASATLASAAAPAVTVAVSVKRSLPSTLVGLRSAPTPLSARIATRTNSSVCPGAKVAAVAAVQPLRPSAETSIPGP